MPYVRIDILKRDIKKKRELARAVTGAIVRALGTQPEKVHLVIHEMKRDQLAVGGVLNADLERKKGKAKKRKNTEKQ